MKMQRKANGVTRTDCVNNEAVREIESRSGTQKCKERENVGWTWWRTERELSLVKVVLVGVGTVCERG